MWDSKVYKKSFDFSIRIYKLFKFLAGKNEHIIAKQILRSGTSIGANIAESNWAVSDLDFSNKLSIAYKEALETKYWIELLKEVGLITVNEHKSLYNDLDEICKMLWSAIKTAKAKNRKY